MSSAQPTILLLGAGGQLGRELAALLPACGTTIALDRAGLDLADADAIARTIRAVGPAFVVNAAAYTEVDRAEDERERAFAVNAVAPGLLAEEARRAGALLVHYSTDYVFDGERTTPYDENAQPNPRNVYGASKLAGERAIAQAGASALILRTSWVYSRTGRNFLTTMERLALERDELRVVADQTGVPNWTRALARITAALIARGRDDLARHAGLYHLSARGEATWHAFARAILDGRAVRVTPIATAEYPTRARRPAYAVLDASHFERVFGLALPHWTEWLRECLRSPAAPQPAMSKAS
ncbi:MAG TPA: dTDP-4-dehydrorhamnose reductase [Casimicrobiaceae bacterium]|nr:dTDP-4-dehydrorhamnose reductase [Casimicrobiaceae bacterium]